MWDNQAVLAHFESIIHNPFEDGDEEDQSDEAAEVPPDSDSETEGEEGGRNSDPGLEGAEVVRSKIDNP